MMNTQTINFLKEVAAELISKGISEPTTEQISDAMAARINRQGELCTRMFGGSTVWAGARVTAEREFVRALAESVYNELRNSEAK